MKDRGKSPMMAIERGRRMVNIHFWTISFKGDKSAISCVDYLKSSSSPLCDLDVKC
jgi:hypothetical protein